MNNLNGNEKKFLRGLAHSLKPCVTIGQNGLTKSVLNACEQALNTHELIKMQFIDFKKKATKEEISNKIMEGLNCELVGMIGHKVIFFRQNKNPKKQKIKIPAGKK